MESTGNYHAPMAWLLHDAGLYVSIVNAMLVHDYGNNSLRRGKTDKKDAVKLANYGLGPLAHVAEICPGGGYSAYAEDLLPTVPAVFQSKDHAEKQLNFPVGYSFPDANRLFTSSPRTDGSEKWVDFVATFWHCECICGLSEKAFTTKYQKVVQKARLQFQRG